MQAAPNLPQADCYRVPLGVLLSVAAVLSAFICWAVWPGFMSFDSLHILEQARFGIKDNLHPALVVYFESLCDRLLPGPGLVFVIQTTVYVFSLATIVWLLKLRRPTAAVCAVVGLTLIPSILGPLLVVWKDVQAMSFFCAAFACILFAEQRRSKAAALLGFLFLFLAASFRYGNTLVAAIPLLWYLNRVRQSGSSDSLPKPKAKPVALTACQAGLAALVLFVLNTYSLPDFHRLPGCPISPLESFDLIGISHFSGKLLVPPGFYVQQRPFTLSNLGYFPQQAEYSYDQAPFFAGFKPLSADALHTLEASGYFRSASGAEVSANDLARRWVSAIRNYPLSYARHRLTVIAAFFDIGRDSVYYPTHPQIDPNHLGISLSGSCMRMPLLAFVYFGAGTIVAFPWFYLLSALLLLVYLLAKRPPWYQPPLVLLLSALVMWAVMLPVTMAADYRYHCWSIAATLLAYLIAVCRLSARGSTA